MEPGNPNPPAQLHILDNVAGFEKDILSPRLVRILVIVIVLVCTFNLFLTTVAISDTTKSLFPEMRPSLAILRRTSIPILIVIPLGCMMLSSLLSLIPFRNKSYSQKFNAAMLLLLLSTESILTILLLTT